jgi:hypothetical protein
MHAISRMTATEFANLEQTHANPFIGLEHGEETLAFLWENFSAAGGDQPGLECAPPLNEIPRLHDQILCRLFLFTKQR